MKPILATISIMLAVLYYGERQTTRQLREDARYSLEAQQSYEDAYQALDAAWRAAYEQNDQAWQQLYLRANEDWSDSMMRLLDGSSLEYRPVKAWEI